MYSIAVYFVSILVGARDSSSDGGVVWGTVAEAKILTVTLMEMKFCRKLAT